VGDVNGVTDIHIHIQPWEQMKPKVTEAMRRSHVDHWDFLISLMKSPALLIEKLDEARIWRVGLVNYPSPDVMGFDDSTNDFAARYAQHDPERLLPYGGVHPRFTKDPKGAVDRLVELGIRCLKIHPPHQVFPANAYTEGLDALGAIYRRCEERGLPVMIHTGTSIFPGARCKYGHPMEVDDVALDFPDLPIILAHAGRPLWTEEAFFILRRHRNVWLDISGIPPKRLLHYLPRIGELGPKVLWGTDWPSPGVRDLRVNLDQFLGLDLDEAYKRQVTVEAPLRMFPSRSGATAAPPGAPLERGERP
jgi:predicted TIM-barrel fold metal-dependent hydrolase